LELSAANLNLINILAMTWPGRQSLSSPALVPSVPASTELALVLVLHREAVRCNRIINSRGSSSSSSTYRKQKQPEWCDQDCFISALTFANVLGSSCTASKVGACIVCNDTGASLLLLVYFALVAKALHEKQGGLPIRPKLSSSNPCIKEQEQQQQQQQQQQQTVPAYHDILLRMLNVPPEVSWELPVDNEAIRADVNEIFEYLINEPEMYSLQLPTSGSSSSNGRTHLQTGACLSAAEECWCPSCSWSRSFCCCSQISHAL